MQTTQSTLLQRIRDNGDKSAWREFDRIYRPLLYHYGRKRGLSRIDAEEIVQQCMLVITRHAARFDYDRARGGFKNWLRTMVDNKIRDAFRRNRARTAQTPDLQRKPSPVEIWERQWEKEHLRHCLEQLRQELSVKHYEAFDLFVLRERPAADVAARLGLSANNVWVIKSRVLRRLREMMRAFLEGCSD